MSSYNLAPTARFRKRFKAFRKKHPDLLITIDDRLELLRQDPHNVRLKTHKLSGTLQGCWAASVSYEYRIVFRLDEDVIYLLSIGTHDEVY